MATRVINKLQSFGHDNDERCNGRACAVPFTYSNSFQMIYVMTSIASGSGGNPEYYTT